jgi:hypothetical protein
VIKCNVNGESDKAIMQEKSNLHQHDLHEPDDDRDDLEDFIAEIAKTDPDFPARVEAGVQQRIAARARGEDLNDIPWDDEEEDAASPQPTAPQHN